MEKMKKLLTAALSALVLAGAAQAQNMDQIQRLYNSGMYSEALRLTQQVKDPSAQGFRVLCELEMRTDNAHTLAHQFLDTYPENFLAPQVRYRLGLDYFDAERYEDALTQFNRLSLEDLPDSQKAEYTYKLGYSAFGVGEWERAKGLLVRARGLAYSDYTAPSYYTLGYINYAQKNFKEASEWFLLASKDHRFSALANYYILECRFNEKDYDYVVKFGEDLFDKVPEDRQPHMARIMSESYLVLGDVEKARTYYEKNLAGKPSLNRSDRFYAGEINYLVEDWEGAVENFTQMGERTDSLGQIASYQLGYSYVQLKNKVAAMDAFKQASDLAYSPEIQEDALYNYAKLAFDLNRDTAPFDQYMEKYSTREKGSR